MATLSATFLHLPRICCSSSQPLCPSGDLHGTQIWTYSTVLSEFQAPPHHLRHKWPHTAFVCQGVWTPNCWRHEVREVPSPQLHIGSPWRFQRWIWYGHGNHSIFPKSGCWGPRKLTDDHKFDDVVTYIAVNDITHVESILRLYKQRIGPGVSGGFFGGSRKALGQYHDLYHEVLEDFLFRDMVDDDQTVALECYLRRPELFNMVPGDWNDAFRLFQ